MAKNVALESDLVWVQILSLPFLLSQSCHLSEPHFFHQWNGVFGFSEEKKVLDK